MSALPDVLSQASVTSRQQSHSSHQQTGYDSDSTASQICQIIDSALDVASAAGSDNFELPTWQTKYYDPSSDRSKSAIFASGKEPTVFASDCCSVNSSLCSISTDKSDPRSLEDFMAVFPSSQSSKRSMTSANDSVRSGSTHSSNKRVRNYFASTPAKAKNHGTNQSAVRHNRPKQSGAISRDKTAIVSPTTETRLLEREMEKRLLKSLKVGTRTTSTEKETSATAQYHARQSEEHKKRTVGEFLRAMPSGEVVNTNKWQDHMKDVQRQSAVQNDSGPRTETTEHLPVVDRSGAQDFDSLFGSPRSTPKPVNQTKPGDQELRDNLMLDAGDQELRDNLMLDEKHIKLPNVNSFDLVDWQTRRHQLISGPIYRSDEPRHFEGLFVSPPIIPIPAKQNGSKESSKPAKDKSLQPDRNITPLVTTADAAGCPFDLVGWQAKRNELKKQLPMTPEQEPRRKSVSSNIDNNVKASPPIVDRSDPRFYDGLFGSPGRDSEMDIGGCQGPPGWQDSSEEEDNSTVRHKPLIDFKEEEIEGTTIARRREEVESATRVLSASSLVDRHDQPAASSIFDPTVDLPKAASGPTVHKSEPRFYDDLLYVGSTASKPKQSKSKKKIRKPARKKGDVPRSSSSSRTTAETNSSSIRSKKGTKKSEKEGKNESLGFASIKKDSVMDVGPSSFDLLAWQAKRRDDANAAKSGFSTMLSTEKDEESAPSRTSTDRSDPRYYEDLFG